jgi:hypothetical protein
MDRGATTAPLVKPASCSTATALAISTVTQNWELQVRRNLVRGQDLLHREVVVVRRSESAILASSPGDLRRSHGEERPIVRGGSVRVFGEVSVGELVGNVTRDLANPRARGQG